MSTLPAPRSLSLHELASFSVPGLMKIRIEGHGPLPHEGPLLLLANRCSLLDPWLLSLASGRAVHVGATSPLFWLPGLGALASRLNTVPLLPHGEREDSLEAALAYAGVLESARPVVLFEEALFGPKAASGEATKRPRFLDVLLATTSERIAVAPLLALGRGRALKLHQSPLFAPFLRAGASLVDTPYPPVLYPENILRIGRPVYWREGEGDATLEDFGRAIDHSLGALY